MKTEKYNMVCENIYIVAGCKSWNKRVYEEIISNFTGRWFFVSNPHELDQSLKMHEPKYIFFLHWSWKILEEIHQNIDCVCFHMTDVPYGRGGSPLQNLIIRGHKKTKLTALRMVGEFDSGPVYLKEDLSLEGNAEEIFIRATYLCAEMIKRILEEKPRPVEQKGEPTAFKRRDPTESLIPEVHSLPALYDFIRMLDAEGYPSAFLEYKGFRCEFKRAALYNGKIKADVTISKTEEEK